MGTFFSDLKQWSFENFPEKFAAALPKIIVLSLIHI